MTTQKQATANQTLTLARVGRPYGVRGWVHLYSLMIPEDLILKQSSCTISLNHRKNPCSIDAIKPHGNHFVAKLSCITTRESVTEWTNALLIADRSQLAELEDDDSYISDLIGLTVINTEDTLLGEVTDIMPTGANLVLIVSMPSGKETLIPHTPNVIIEINESKQQIVADWEPL